MSENEARGNTYFREFLTERFDIEELRNLAQDFKIDYDEFAIENRTNKAAFSRELIKYFERRGKNLRDLAQRVKHLRGDFNLDRLRLPPPPLPVRVNRWLVIGCAVSSLLLVIQTLLLLLGVIPFSDVEINYRLAKSYDDSQKWSEASKYYQKLVAAGITSFNNDDINYKLGWDNDALKNWAEASKYYQKAADNKPDNKEYLYRTGVTFCYDNHCEKAVPYFEKIVNNLSQQATPHDYNQLIEAYERTNKLDAACNKIVVALNKFKDDKDVASINELKDRQTRLNCNSR